MSYESLSSLSSDDCDNDCDNCGDNCDNYCDNNCDNDSDDDCDNDYDIGCDDEFVPTVLPQQPILPLCTLLLLFACTSLLVPPIKEGGNPCTVCMINTTCSCQYEM